MSLCRVRMQYEQLPGPVLQVNVRHVRGRSRRTLRSMSVRTQSLERTTLGFDKHSMCVCLTSSQGGCAGVCRRPPGGFESYSPRSMHGHRRGMSSVFSSTQDCASENGFPRQDDERVRTRVFKTRFQTRETWLSNSVIFTLE